MLIEAMLTGAALLLAGAALGRVLWPRRRGPKPIEPICGCRHHRSFHDPTGACHALMEGAYAAIRDAAGRPVLDTWGDVQKATEMVPCGCQRYSGPEPLSEIYAPEITDG